MPPNSIDLAQKVQRSLVVEINHYNMAKPTEEESQEFLLSCRYGELDEVKEFVEKFGAEVVSDIRDDRGNSALHMICGNGHLGGFSVLLLHTTCYGKEGDKLTTEDRCPGIPPAPC